MKQLKFWLLAAMGIWILPACVLAQSGPGQAHSFEIYIFPKFYDQDTKNFLLKNNYSIANVMIQAAFDGDNDQVINEGSVRRYCDNFFPGANATGTCIIDWEAQPFKDLKTYEKNDSRFKAAEAKFIELITLIRSLRPNVKVGIYGLPFRFYYPTQRAQYAVGNKLDKLLSKCDLITPSLYIMYSDKQVGRQRNLQYLKENLEVALNYGKRLNKPVMPFVWYRFHPGNKQFGMGIISKGEMGQYLECLVNYSYQGNQISGIVWWEGSDVERPRTNKQGRTFSAKPRIVGVDRDSIIINYTAPFLERRKTRED